MRDRSYTSSSKSTKHDWPWGFFCAVAIVAVVHLATSMICREPVARDALRSKFRALLDQRQPSLVVLGDSRFKCGVVPDILEQTLRLPRASVLNLAESACDPTAVAAACREFSRQLRTSSAMLLNISFFAVNDRATDMVGDEILWNLPASNRAELVPASRVFASFFLPEKAVWSRIVDALPFAARTYKHDGFDSASNDDNVGKWSACHRESRIEALRKWWYDRPRIDGLRWQQFSRDLSDLAGRGPRLVVVMMPEHPAFISSVAGTPAGDAAREFRHKVRKLCEKLGVVCLSYDADCLGVPNPDPMFRDMIHLNQRGAEAFTSILAADLTRHGIPGSDVQVSLNRQRSP